MLVGLNLITTVDNAYYRHLRDYYQTASVSSTTANSDAPTLLASKAASYDSLLLALNGCLYARQGLIRTLCSGTPHVLIFELLNIHSHILLSSLTSSYPLSHPLIHSPLIQSPLTDYIPPHTYNFTLAMDEAGGSSMLATHDSLQPLAARYVKSINTIPNTPRRPSRTLSYTFTHTHTLSRAFSPSLSTLC